MAQGNNIIVSSNPKGVFISGILSGAVYPGTVMEVVPATEPVNGLFTWRVYQPGADGEQRLIAVLLEDELQGKTADAVWASGDRCRLYCPVPGEELNMLLKNISGTSDAFAIGDTLMVDTGTGMLIATTGSPESEAFKCLETVAAITADTLARCMFSGY